MTYSVSVHKSFQRRFRSFYRFIFSYYYLNYIFQTYFSPKPKKIIICTNSNITKHRNPLIFDTRYEFSPLNTHNNLNRRSRSWPTKRFMNDEEGHAHDRLNGSCTMKLGMTDWTVHERRSRSWPTDGSLTMKQVITVHERWSTSWPTKRFIIRKRWSRSWPTERFINDEADHDWHFLLWNKHKKPLSGTGHLGD